MLWNNNFQFCNYGNIKNCNVCPYRINCPRSYLTFVKPQQTPIPPCPPPTPKPPKPTDLEQEIKKLKAENLQLKQLADSRDRQVKALVETRTLLTAENKKLKEENENLKKECGITKQTNATVENGLQTIETSKLAIKEGIPLVAKRGLFGTRYVEDKSKKK